MTDGRTHIEPDWLNALAERLQEGNRIYAAYLQEGRTFRHASILKANNEAIRQLLAQHAASLVPEQQQNCAALAHHLDVWCQLWDALAVSKRFAPDEAFVFENTVNFPREAVAALLALQAQRTTRS